MPAIRFGTHSCQLRENETVLDGLLRHGIPVSHACKAGSCGSCLLRAEEGQVPAAAQAGLKDSWKARGYFLACQCRPDEDLLVAEVGSDARTSAVIRSLDLLSENVLRVRLQCANFAYIPGQYVSLIRGNGLARSYSIASLPKEDAIELHVRRVEGGQMSGWLFDESPKDEEVQLQGPAGECFYVPGKPQQPLLLVGTGTGLAPLYGILRDALRAGHTGPIHLIHGALRPEGLYLCDELRRLAAAHANFSYTASVVHAEAPGHYVVGPVAGLLAERFAELEGWRGFVCGDPALVQALKKKLFLAGMASREIYSDAFLFSA